MLNKYIKWQIDHPDQGLKFVQLDVSLLRLIVFTDASFTNNQNLSSQIGYVICLVDASNRLAISFFLILQLSTNFNDHLHMHTVV